MSLNQLVEFNIVDLIQILQHHSLYLHVHFLFSHVFIYIIGTFFFKLDPAS